MDVTVQQPPEQRRVVSDLHSFLKRTCERLPAWRELNDISKALLEPLFKITDRVADVLPLSSRLEWLLQIRALRRRPPLLVGLVLAWAIWRGLRPTHLGHIATDSLVYPSVSLISGLSPFLGICTAIFFGIGDLVQKIFYNDIYGAEGRGSDYFASLGGYTVAYSAVIVAGILPGVLARITGRATGATVRYVRAQRAATADGAGFANTYWDSLIELVGAAAGGFLGGYLSVNNAAPVLERPAFYWRPHPDESCFRTEVNILRDSADSGGLGGGTGSLGNDPDDVVTTSGSGSGASRGGRRGP